MVKLQQAIIYDPLIVSQDTSIVAAMVQMSAARASCGLAVEVSMTATEEALGEARASCLCVVEDGKLIGIITERDIIRLTVTGQLRAENTVKDTMTHPVVTLQADRLIDMFDVLALFRQHHIRHLPLVDPQDNLVGLVTHESVRRLLQPADLLRL
ncbi:MAG: CBS domain-containing protein, partial [Cyanobacteria bacterium]|nr:CBS domain-containing protein [Cyanobacteriota bacterium]